MKKRYYGFRKSGYTPNILIILALIVMIILIIMIIAGRKQTKVKEVVTEKRTSVSAGEIIEKETIREAVYTIPTKEYLSGLAGAALELESFEEAIEVEPAETIPSEVGIVETVEVVKHFPESTYIKGAILLTGEAVGVPSLTRKSGCLWVVCNRVLSPKFPNNIEAVIEEASQFDGYTPNGYYTEECYNLAVDVFERFYRECSGETAVEVGRSLPSDYLYFSGDGKENYFKKTQTGKSYVWGSMLISPYKN